MENGHLDLQQINYINNLMDNQSNESDQQVDIGTSQTKKPSNRNRFEHKGFIITSEFPGGNLKAASFQEQFRMQGKTALVVEFWGNSDAQVDPLDKSWFYFSIVGIKEIAKMGYEEIIFRFKNANNYRKFIREKRFKPYIALKEVSQNTEEEWETLYVSKINILQTQIIEAQFVYTVKPDINCAYFAENLPYTLKDAEKMHENIQSYLQLNQNNVYYHRQIIARSVDDYPVYMCTVTSIKNILFNSPEREPELASSSNRQQQFSIKNKPEVIITARVHPSETSSSFCVEGILENLIKNSSLDLLLDFFVFRIIPMVNPDGVENGHYRLDNYLQNLNRYYGHSDQTKTPPIFSIQKLITNLRQKSKLFFFMDIHGHNSPKPSFIFGNFSQNIYQTLENKTFVKIIDMLSEGNFDSSGCQFSKKHMSVKQKYDQHSKEASARVFAFRGNHQQQTSTIENKNILFVEHSYTLEINPYIIADSSIRRSLCKKPSKQASNSYKNLLKISSSKRMDNLPATIEPTEAEIVDQYKKIGQNVLMAILEIIGANCHLKTLQVDDCLVIRKRNFKQISKLLEFYDRSKKLKAKEINRELFQRYYQKWNFIEYFKQYLQVNSQNETVKKKLKSCFMHEFYEEWTLKNQKQQQFNSKKIKVTAKLVKNMEVKMENQQEDHPVQEKQRQLLPRATVSKQTQQKAKVLQAKQFEMLDKMEPRENHKSSYHSNLGNYKKAINTETSQIQLLERKIRKLMFRHRTEIEIPDSSNEKYYESINHRGEAVDEGVKSHKVTINPKQARKKDAHINKLEPLNKSKKGKAFHIKTQEQKFQPEFNDQNVIARQETTVYKKLNQLEGLQPRIQEFVRKLSQHKQDLNTIQHNQIKDDLAKIKSTGITLNERKMNSRGSHQYLKQSHKVVKQVDAEEQVTLYYNHIAESAVTEVRQSPKIETELDMELDEEASLLKGRLTGYNKSVKSKLQKVEGSPNISNEQEVQKIVRSFRVLAGETNTNRAQFIQKAKKILSEKKRQLKTLEEPYLPIISQFDPFGVPKKSKL